MDKLISNAVNTGRCFTVTYYRALVGIPYANTHWIQPKYCIISISVKFLK